MMEWNRDRHRQITRCGLEVQKIAAAGIGTKSTDWLGPMASLQGRDLTPGNAQIKF